MVGIQDADAARRASLSGNVLIEDRDDVYLWPQLVVNHANLAAFEYGPNAGTGNATLLWGDDRMAFGVAVHRGDLFDNNLFPYNGLSPAGALSDLGDPAVPLAGTIGVNSGTILDLFAGFDVGGGLAGARLAIGNGGDSSTPADPDATQTSNGVTFIKLQGGYSLSGPLTLDTALTLNFATGSNDVTTPDDDFSTQEGTNFGLGLKVRGYSELASEFDLGFLGDIVYNSTSIDRTADPDADTITSSQSGFALQAGVGPVWELGGADFDTVIAGYGVLGFSSTSNDADTDTDDNATGNSAWLLPGFNLAADIQLLDWLYFRSGAQYLWAIQGASQENANFDGDDEQSLRGPGGFGWTAGLGIEKGNFRFDGTFAENFLVNGPNFIGGGTGFLTMASVEYAWE
jgi:hypothetical protein